MSKTIVSGRERPSTLANPPGGVGDLGAAGAGAGTGEPPRALRDVRERAASV